MLVDFNHLSLQPREVPMSRRHNPKQDCVAFTGQHILCYSCFLRLTKMTVSLAFRDIGVDTTLHSADIHSTTGPRHCVHTAWTKWITAVFHWMQASLYLLSARKQCVPHAASITSQCGPSHSWHRVCQPPADPLMHQLSQIYAASRLSSRVTICLQCYLKMDEFFTKILGLTYIQSLGNQHVYQGELVPRICLLYTSRCV